MPKLGFLLTSQGAERLRERLAEEGLSQEVIADELNVTARTLRNWLAADTRIDSVHLEQLLTRLGVGPQEVLERNDYLQYFCKPSVLEAWKALRALAVSGAMSGAVTRYRDMVSAMLRHVSFSRIPDRGPFRKITQGGDQQQCYLHVAIEPGMRVEETSFLLSFLFLDLVRVNIGKIVVDRRVVTALPFFQRYPHRVERDPEDAAIRFAMWVNGYGSIFFVESEDGLVFQAKIVEGLNEAEMARQADRIVVFWKGVWH